MRCIKSYIITKYGKWIYTDTQQLQVKFVHPKNQFIFLQRCIANNVIPKSFQVKTPIMSRKGKFLLCEYQQKPLRLEKDEAKKRVYASKSRILFMMNTLKEHSLAKGRL